MILDSSYTKSISTPRHGDIVDTEFAVSVIMLLFLLFIQPYRGERMYRVSVKSCKISFDSLHSDDLRRLRAHCSCGGSSSAQVYRVVR